MKNINKKKGFLCRRQPPPHRSKTIHHRDAGERRRKSRSQISEVRFLVFSDL
jgi:hypothetical protein